MSRIAIQPEPAIRPPTPHIKPATLGQRHSVATATSSLHNLHMIQPWYLAGSQARGTGGVAKAEAAVFASTPGENLACVAEGEAVPPSCYYLNKVDEIEKLKNWKNWKNRKNLKKLRNRMLENKTFFCVFCGVWKGEGGDE